MTTDSASAARSAALLDELFRSGTTGPFVDACRAIAPPGWADQVDAAVDELAEGVRRVDAAAADVHLLPYSGYPAWVTLGLLQVLAEFATGTAATCIHQPTAAAPRPIHAAAWKPSLIVCSSCLHLLKLARSDVRDRTCDGCGHQCAGPEADDGIWSHVIVAGALTYSVGVCGGCRWTTTPQPPKDSL